MANRYQNIDTATTNMGYGTLVSEYDKRHASGLTTTGAIIWLPIMFDIDNNWYNMYDNNDTKELVIQIANKEPAKRDWRVGVLVKETSHVIARTNSDGKTYKYEDIGEYCAILFDSSRCLSLHAKVGSPLTSGNEFHVNGLSWVSGFAATENEAWAKLDKLVGSTLKLLRER